MKRLYKIIIIVAMSMLFASVQFCSQIDIKKEPS